MKYRCEFPLGCDFETDFKLYIHNHHIIPKEAGGSNEKWNRIYLCPLHHAFIFCKESKHGNHSIKTPKSIILKGWRLSSEGKILEYEDMNGETNFYCRKQVDFSEDKV